MYVHPAADTLSSGYYMKEATLHTEVGGPAVRTIRCFTDKVTSHPSQPEMEFASIKDALMSGVPAHYRLTLSECYSDETDINQPVIGGPVNDFELIPPNIFGPAAGYLRIASDQMIVGLNGMY